jgi:hypothetical protein
MKYVTLPKILKPFYCEDLIRVGKNHDGGYIVNKKDVMKSEHLLSFGVGNDISFEQDFVELCPCPVDAYDGTVDNTNEFFSEDRSFHKKNIGRDCEDFISLKNNTFIKCDIEGYEYEILSFLISNSKYISGAVIEFHHVYEYDLFNELTNFIAKFGLKLIHVHANNNSYIELDDRIVPDCLELSFSSSENLEYKEQIDLPHKLDMPNSIFRDELKIVW